MEILLHILIDVNAFEKEPEMMFLKKNWKYCDYIYCNYMNWHVMLLFYLLTNISFFSVAACNGSDDEFMMPNIVTLYKLLDRESEFQCVLTGLPKEQICMRAACMDWK
jgi:hypothetical protein